MSQELWRRVEALFHSALELAPEARKAFLDEACGNDDHLRQQVEMLVSKDAHADSLWDQPLVSDVTGALSVAGSLTGSQLGNYQILSLLGAGGMGEVQLFSRSGGPPLVVGSNAWLRWSRDRRSVWMEGGPVPDGRTYIIRLARDEAVPSFPPGGFHSEAEIARLPGARRIDVTGAPGPMWRMAKSWAL